MAFYFVSQGNQKNENEMGKLTAPDNKKYGYIKNTKKDDLIIQYNSVSRCITGVAVANKNPYVSGDKIYIDVDIYSFSVVLPKKSWVKQLRERQNGLKTPVNENLGINSRYLQKMNTESFDYVLDVAEKNSANKDVVQKIRNMSKSTPSYDIDDTLYDDENDEGNSMQQIFFGAPGTGKSFKVNQKAPKDDKVTFRTTFHPDYDYAQFVGSYKPTRKTFAIQKLDKEELKSYANAFINDKANEGFSLCKFAAVYSESLEDLGRADRRYVIEDAAIGKTDKNEAISDKTLSASINNGISVGKLLKSKLSFNQETISYSFVPQVFAKAYVAAWENYLVDQKKPQSVYLVIEEINRGNCAQIFGDIFQLLDRKDGHSEYPIDVDSDFATYIRETLGDKFATYKEMICSHCKDAATGNATPDEKFCKIALPSNFNILATMNTSDQSLFPMDSAFKRRFDWEYVPIDYKQTKAEFKVSLKRDEGDNKPLEFDWLHFLKKINADISMVTESEDKQMGEFFVKPKDGVIGLDMFRSKILFYLWDSVYKDEPDKKNVFHFDYPEKSGSKVTFQSLFGDDAKAIEIIKQMMKNLDKAYESKDDSEFKDFKILK